MILLGILFDFIPLGGELFMFALFGGFFYYMLRLPSWRSKREDCEEELRDIARLLEEEEPDAPSRPSVPSSPYAGMSEGEMRRRADRLEREVKQMR